MKNFTTYEQQCKAEFAKLIARYDTLAVAQDGSVYGCYAEDIPTDAVDTYYGITSPEAAQAFWAWKDFPITEG